VHERRDADAVARQSKEGEHRPEALEPLRAPSSIGGHVANVARCRSCEAPILWAETINGKRIPLDEAPVEDGRFVLDETYDPPLAEYAKGGDPREKFTSHFATCAQADRWRKS
jgi:hypothetical protein